MKKAIENLSMGIDFSSEGLTATEGDASGVSLPLRQPVSSPLVEKAIDTPSAFQIGDETPHWGFVRGSTSQGSQVQSNIFGQPPVRPSAAQLLPFQPGAFQINQPHAPKTPFPSFASGSTPSSFLALATTLPPATGTAAGYLGSPQASKAASSMFGNPEQTTVLDANGT